VYSILVAHDAFENLYMVPLDDIMVDIRNELDAEEVTLPYSLTGKPRKDELFSNRMAAELPEQPIWANLKRAGDEQYGNRSEDVAQRAELNMNEE
jgi:hypothetical protein